MQLPQTYCTASFQLDAPLGQPKGEAAQKRCPRGYTLGPRRAIRTHPVEDGCPSPVLHPRVWPPMPGPLEAPQE
eukprot:2487720-Pyramimonas_sp.AAC.1